ncbi:MAG: hypothetical protein ACHQK9_14940 [Reyranellales bacterium]
MAAVLLAVAFASPARADSLTISGQNLSWGGSGVSPTFTVGIENLTSPATDQLFAWQLGLLIVPEASATGTLKFLTATLPSNYVLAGKTTTGLLPAFSGPSTSISPFIGDATSDPTGVVVPASGDNLLAVTFTASSNAKGFFDIFAVPLVVPGAPASTWFDQNFNQRDFANVPSTGGNVQIGTMDIGQASIPEPQSVVLLISGVLTLVAYRLVRRGRVA